MKYKLIPESSPINFLRNNGITAGIFLLMIILFIVLLIVPMGLGLISFDVDYRTVSFFQRACSFVGVMLAFIGIMALAESKKAFLAWTTASLVLLATPLFIQ